MSPEIYIYIRVRVCHSDRREEETILQSFCFVTAKNMSSWKTIVMTIMNNCYHIEIDNLMKTKFFFFTFCNKDDHFFFFLQW